LGCRQQTRRLGGRRRRWRLPEIRRRSAHSKV